MPETTPKQKVERVKMFGGDFIKIILSGDNLMMHKKRLKTPYR